MTRKKTYGQFCPVAKAAEVVAERWTPLVLRELICGSSRFSELKKGVPLMSPSLLSQRLKELEYAGVIETRPASSGRGSEYFLTEGGEQLAPLIEGLGHWGKRWLKPEFEEGDLDPGLLMWDIQRRIDLSAAPDQPRTTIKFVINGVPANFRNWWVVYEHGDTDLCMKDPGFEVDLYVTMPMRTAAEIWIGRTPIAQAVRDGDLTLDGSKNQVNAFHRWFALSVFAPT